MGRDGEHRVERITETNLAEVYGVHVNTVGNWIRAGKLRGLRLAEILEFDRARRIKKSRG
jgi:transposase